MRFVMVYHDGRERPGVLDGEGVVLLPHADLVAVIEDGLGALGNDRVALADVRLLAPIRRFRRDIVCTGWNYWDHFEESKGKGEGQDVDRPEHPTFFTKGPDVVIGSYDEIAYDPAQWLKGKSIDQTMPLGPWIVSADELGDPQDVRLQCQLNGEVMQDASTKQMAYDVATLVSELSFGMTLRPGDLLLTGTPAGIGNAREPQVFLKEGDEVITRSDQLGELRNTLAYRELS